MRHFDPEPSGLTSLMLNMQGWYSKPSARHREAHYARLRDYFTQSGLEAVADLPFPGFVEELAAAFPDALVVLTVRKDVLRWVSSAATQLNRYRAQTDLIRSTTYQVGTRSI